MNIVQVNFINSITQKRYTYKVPNGISLNKGDIIRVRNKDGSCPYNKATYSSELCEKLLTLYAPEGATVYDPFLGSGTTAVACKRLGLNCYGSEISKNQCEWAFNRLKEVTYDSGST